MLSIMQSNEGSGRGTTGLNGPAHLNDPGTPVGDCMVVPLTGSPGNEGSAEGVTRTPLKESGRHRPDA